MRHLVVVGVLGRGRLLPVTRQLKPNEQLAGVHGSTVIRVQDTKQAPQACHRRILVAHRPPSSSWTRATASDATAYVLAFEVRKPF